MKIRAFVMAAAALAVPMVLSAPDPVAHASSPWGACGIRTDESKVVTTYGDWKLLCGNKNYGYRHIQDRHQAEWEGLADIEGRNWRDIADMAIAKAHDAPDWHGPQGAGKYCYTGQIYLVNHVTGAIVKTVQPTVIVAENGQVVTAFPGGACRGQV